MSTSVDPELPVFVGEEGVAAPSAERYASVQASDEFAGLRRALRNFVFPVTVAFLTWYLLYVVMSAYGRDFMGTKVIGNVNVALIFGVLQFVSTFLIAWAYSRYADAKLDPISSKIRTDFEGDA
jgi:uncharacterized membrane protein (DUF485 family)